MHIITQTLAKIRSVNMSRSTMIIIGVAVLAVGAGVAFSMFSGGELEQALESKRHVKTASVAELMGGGSSLSSIADIKSVSEAKISPEIGGRIVRVRASLGQKVSAGQVLAEIENASQRAAVLQSEGALDAAKAALQKIQGGTREEQLAILESSEAGARSSAVNTLLSAYATAENAVHDDIDPTLLNPETSSPSYRVVSSQSQLANDLQNQRPALSAILKRHVERAKTLTSTDDLDAELGKTEEELRMIRAYLDVLVRSLNNGIPSRDFTSDDIAGFLANAQAARTAVTMSLSGITGARAALESAGKTLEQGVEGAESEDVASAQASVKSAQGSYNAALANLEKTIIRSPISGTLNNFTIKLGDTVAPTQQVAIVSNNAALEAVMYVTEDDRNRIAIGQKVTMENDVMGTVTKIAPALDPVTRRIEVRIGLPATAINVLTNGQSVRVQLDNESTATKPVEGPLSIPIVALKIESERKIVFAVENGRVAAKEIKIGKLSGSSVQVTGGLEADTVIIVDARGLKEGDEVEIAK